MKERATKTRASGVRRSGKRGHSAGRASVTQIEMLSRRVAAATTTWKQAKEQASQAKRRRKLARLLAKRAKKDAKTAKLRLDELREALAGAQAGRINPWRAAA